MRLLIDNSLSWRVGRDLREFGHDVVHVADLGMAAADDRVVYLRACAEGRIILTQDSDFGPIHAAASTRVGLVLLRLSDGRPRVQAVILGTNLPDLTAALGAGAFVTIEDGGLRILETGN